MATRDEGEGLPIGEVLKRTRTRRKIDIRTVEQQTKIRIKYLRALENEEWDVLPGPPTPRASCAPTPSSSASTATRWSTSTGGRSRRRSTPTAPICSASPCWSAAAGPARSRGAAGRCGRPRSASWRGRRGRCCWSCGLTGSDDGGKDAHRQKGKHEHAQHGSGGGTRTQGGVPVAAGDGGADHARLHGGLPGDRRRAGADRRADADLGHQGGPLPAAGRQLPPRPLERGGAHPDPRRQAALACAPSGPASYEISSTAAFNPIDFKGPKCP